MSRSHRSRRATQLGVVLAVALGGCATAPRTQSVADAMVDVGALGETPFHAPSTAGLVPPGMQYLYGSGEGAALSVQAWRGLASYVQRQVATAPADSVVLAAGTTLAAPRWVPCGAKPKAVVLDVDETVLLNLGFEADDAAHPGRAYDDARWQAWERTGAGAVAPVPGARDALDVVRQMGVAVVFNTNRSVANAAATQATIEGTGLGPAVHGETLYLQGDDATGSRKDARRAAIAARYCVLAMGGDQLGDFSDLFGAGLPPPARRAAALSPPIAAKFGAGWFVLPNPVYGAGVKGDMDDVFPADKRWSPPAQQER